jgi:hypothetical protein
MVVRALSADHAAAKRYSYTCNYAYNRGVSVCTTRLGAVMDDADRGRSEGSGPAVAA